MKSSSESAAAEERRIWVNGRPRPLETGTTLAGLLQELDASGPGVAVERNQEVVRKTDYQAVVLADGDRVEVVRLVGGG